MEYESIADPNRCLLPADLLTPSAAAETAFLAGQTVSPRRSREGTGSGDTVRRLRFCAIALLASGGGHGVAADLRHHRNRLDTSIGIGLQYADGFSSANLEHDPEKFADFSEKIMRQTKEIESASDSM
jgi:hypothetical protein